MQRLDVAFRQRQLETQERQHNERLEFESEQARARVDDADSNRRLILECAKLFSDVFAKQQYTQQ